MFGKMKSALQGFITEKNQNRREEIKNEHKLKEPNTFYFCVSISCT